MPEVSCGLDALGRKRMKELRFRSFVKKGWRGHVLKVKTAQLKFRGTTSEGEAGQVGDEGR
jgi:hypothetical protein